MLLELLRQRHTLDLDRQAIVRRVHATKDGDDLVILILVQLRQLEPEFIGQRIISRHSDEARRSHEFPTVDNGWIEGPHLDTNARDLDVGKPARPVGGSGRLQPIKVVGPLIRSILGDSQQTAINCHIAEDVAIPESTRIELEHQRIDPGDQALGPRQSGRPQLETIYLEQI